MAAVILVLLGFGIDSGARAQDATWAGPGADWNTNANWSPATTPTDKAIFAGASPTTLTFSVTNADTNINTLQFNAGAPAYTFNNVVSLFINGAGIVNNSSNAPTFNVVVGGVNSNGLNFTNSATAGNAIIVNNFGVGFIDSSTAGNAIITNNDAIGFQNSASAGNATIFSAGSGIIATTIDFGFTATAGHATITNGFNGLITFEESATAGNASITNNNGGVMQFINNSTAGNATITTDNGSYASFLDSSTGGNARFITNAGGVVDISNLSAAGMTAGSIEGAGDYYLGAKTLTVGSNNLSTVVSGVISDCGPTGTDCNGAPAAGGSLVKTGTGTLTLSGINTYTGATTVNGGALIVDGSIAASPLTTVNAGATLGGSGTVGNTAIIGGTLAPGSTTGSVFGPLTVQGNLSLTAASTYLIQVSPANAGRTNVTGTAMLGGATVDAMFMPGSYVSRQYTIVNSTGLLSGMFNPTVVSNMTSLQSSLSYDNHDAYLNIKLNFTPPSGNLNINQQNVANALTNYFNSNGGIPMVYGTLTPAGLTQASGELATASQQTTFDAMGLFMGLLTNPFMNRTGAGAAPGPIGYADEALGYAASKRGDAYAMFTKAPLPAPFVQRWSVWTAGYGGSQTTEGNAVLGSNNTTSSIAATAVGADYLFSPNTIAGFALAGGGTNFSVNGLGSGRSDLFQAGAYVRHTEGPAYVSAALAYGWQDITTNRTVTIAGTDVLHAEFNANAFSGRLEGGYRYTTPWMGITPYAAAQFTTFDLPAYAESVLSGGGAFALAYNAKSVTDTRSELGFRTDKSWAIMDSMFTLRGRVAWAHDFDPDRSIAATFQALPGASFVVNGAAQAHDSALTTASAEVKWKNGWSAAATFEGEFSNVSSSYAGKGVVRYVW